MYSCLGPKAWKLLSVRQRGHSVTLVPKKGEEREEPTEVRAWVNVGDQTLARWGGAEGKDSTQFPELLREAVRQEAAQRREQPKIYVEGATQAPWELGELGQDRDPPQALELGEHSPATLLPGNRRPTHLTPINSWLPPE